MRIALEFHSVLVNRFSGFYTYGAGLLEGFAQQDDPPEIVLFLSKKVAPGKQWLGSLLDAPHVSTCTCGLKLRHLEQWWRCVPWPSLQQWTGDFDLYHCNHHLMSPTKNRPRVLTVHDLRRYRFPEFYPKSKLGPFERALQQADHLIAISQATKNDLCEVLDVNADKISVVYHGGPLGGLTPAKTADDAPLPQLIQDDTLQTGRYFCAFSSYDKRKNLDNIVRAFALATRKLDNDFRLLVIGQFPQWQEIENDPLIKPIAARIVAPGPMADFKGLLTQGAGLIYTSYYEGFGLPILEAMAADTPVITSDCSSMPEVAGTAALLVPPSEPEQIAAALVRLANESSLRDRLIADGRQRAGEFSWKRAAAETRAVYESLL